MDINNAILRVQQVFIALFPCKLRLEGCSTVFFLRSSTNGTNHSPEVRTSSHMGISSSQAQGSRRNRASEHFPAVDGKGAVAGQQQARRYTFL